MSFKLKIDVLFTNLLRVDNYELVCVRHIFQSELFPIPHPDGRGDIVEVQIVPPGDNYGRPPGHAVRIRDVVGTFTEVDFLGIK